MKGTVHTINSARGMVAIETEGYGFTIIELLGDQVEVGDEMSWKNDTELGRALYTNETRGETIEVYVQNHHVSKSILRQQLRF